MYRGVANFNKNEVVQLQELISDRHLAVPALQEKLNLIPQTTPQDAFTVEINADIVEIILDNLPAPAEADPATNHLRTKLVQLLQKLQKDTHE